MVATTGTTSTFDVGTGIVSQTGLLSGDGNLNVTGSGILAINNLGNTFTGTFTQTSGTLAGIGSLPGPVFLNGVLSPGAATGGLGNLTLGSNGNAVTLTSRVVVDLDATGAVANSDAITVLQDVAFGAEATVSPLFSGTPTTADHTILTYGGFRTGAPVLDPSLQVRGLGFNLDSTGVPNAVVLRVTGTAAPASLTWSGDGTGNVWNVNSTANWTGSTFYQYDDVLFNDAGNNAANINLTGQIRPGSLTFEGGKSYTFAGAGAVTGSAALTQNGTGGVTFLTDASLGPVIINSGTLAIGNGGATGSLTGLGTVTLAFGATLEFNHTHPLTWTRAFTAGSSGTLVKKGSGALTTNAVFQLLPTFLTIDGGTLTVAGGGFSSNRMEGDGLVTVNPGATLVLAAGSAHAFGGNNATMTEAFVINGGTLTINQEQYFNKLTLTGATMNGTADARSSSGANLWTVNGTAPTTISCPVTNFNNTNFAVEDVTGSAAPDLILTNNMTGGSGLNKTGPGTLRSSGATGSFLGPVNINAGTFEAASARALGFGGAIGNATVAGTTVAAGAVLDLQGVTVNEIITLNSGGILTNTNPTATGVLSNGLAGVRVVDVGSGYTAAPTVAFSGGGGAGATATTVVTTGALTSVTTTAAGTGYTSAPTVTLTGVGTLASAAASISTLILNGTGNQIGGPGALSIPAVIAGSGSYRKIGTGTLTIPTAASTFTGDISVESGTLAVNGLSAGINTGLGANLGSRTITLNGGTLAFGINNVLGNGATAPATLPSIAINNGAVFTSNNYNVTGPLLLNGGTVTLSRTGTPGAYQGFEFKGRISADGPVLSTITTINNFGHHLAGNITFDVADGAAGDDLVVSAPLLNASPDNPGVQGGLTKTGLGTLALNGANTYPGTTTVASGILSGSGRVTGPLTINANATLSPGSGTAPFAAGSTTLAGTYDCDLSGVANDTLTITGDLTLTGGTLRISVGAAPTLPLYVIATCTGTLTGSFATVSGMPAGYSLNYNTTARQIEITNAAGNPYTAWESLNNIPGAGASADSDGDAIPNGIEFVLATDPSGPDSESSAQLPTLSADGTYLNYVFRRADQSISSNPIVQYGSALAGWTTAITGQPVDSPVLTLVDDDFFGAGVDRVTVRIPRTLATEARLFARLKVEIP